MAPSELVCVLAVKIIIDASERQPKNRSVKIVVDASEPAKESLSIYLAWFPAVLA